MAIGNNSSLSLEFAKLKTDTAFLLYGSSVCSKLYVKNVNAGRAKAVLDWVARQLKIYFIVI